MYFVVKATRPSGDATWLSAPTFDGIRTLVLRATADGFRTQENARTAIAKMPASFAKAGVLFSVESAE